jgi:hypothetical protein
MSQAQKELGFYEAKGMVRRTIILSENHFKKLKDSAKQVRLTQGEVLEVLLDNADFDALAGQFQVKRQSKQGGRQVDSALVKKMKGASPEKLAQIQAILDGQ